MAPVKRAPIETKTQAAGLAGAVSGVAVYLLQTYVFKGTLNAGLVSLIYAAVPGVLAFGAAYLAPHTPRPAAPAPSPYPLPGVTVTPPPPVTRITGVGAVPSGLGDAPLPPVTGGEI
jgi:hypothetical protein